jgi:hypothetical protein
MKHSMIDTYSDEFGALDFQRSQHGAGSSKQAQVRSKHDNCYAKLCFVIELHMLCSLMPLNSFAGKDFCCCSSKIEREELQFVVYTSRVKADCFGRLIIGAFALTQRNC